MDAMIASRSIQRLLIGVLALLLAAIVAVVLAVGSGGAGSAPSGADGSAFDGPTMPPGLRAAGFSLRDQDGRTVSLRALRGQVVVLTFIHSKCQDACPLTVEDIKGALNLLPGGGHGVVPVAISAEPAQDTVASRRAFLAQHEMTGRLAYLNGPARALWPIWNAYHVLPVLPGKPDHTAFTLLIDRRGVERVGFPAEQMTPEALAHDIRVLQAERA
jgi:protein SCO1/2